MWCAVDGFVWCRSLGIVCTCVQVLLSELASPTLVPTPSSALGCLFETLHHACGVEVLRAPRVGGAGSGSGDLAHPVTDKRVPDPLVARAVATVSTAEPLRDCACVGDRLASVLPTVPYCKHQPQVCCLTTVCVMFVQVIAATALTNATSSVGDGDEAGALQPVFPYRTVGPRLLAYALHVGATAGPPSAAGLPSSPASPSVKSDGTVRS